MGAARPVDPPPDIVAAITRCPRWTRVEHVPEVGSTNAVVAERVAAGEPPGLVVVADRQSAGRGRHGRRWEDVAGGSVLASWLLAAPPEATLVPLAAGLAVVDVGAQVGAPLALKWPNDVLADGAKCAGVLVEAPSPQRLVVGTGVNVDWGGVAHDPAWATLAEVTGRPLDRWELLAALAAALDRRLTEVETSPGALLDAYRERCVTLGQAVRVVLPAGVVVGTAEDVDADGALVVRTGERTVALRAGDVEHLRAVGGR